MRRGVPAQLQIVCFQLIESLSIREKERRDYGLLLCSYHAAINTGIKWKVLEAMDDRKGRSSSRRKFRKVGEEVERRRPYTKHTLICCSFTSDGWQVLVGDSISSFCGWSYQVAHYNLGFSGSSSWSSRYGSLDGSSSRSSILLNPSDGRCSGGSSRRATSSTATTASTGAIRADNLLKSHVELSRHFQLVLIEIFFVTRKMLS